MRYFKWFIGVIIIIFGIPLFLEFCIFRNDFPSVLKNSEWASFLGSFLGGLISLVGIYLTIKYTQAENKKERELMYKPHIRICACKPDEKFDYICIPTKSNCCYTENGKNCGIGIKIKNVGLGPLINFSLSEFKYVHKRNGEVICPIKYGHDDFFEKEEILQLYFEFDLDIHDKDLEGILPQDTNKILKFMNYGGEFSFVIKGNDLSGEPYIKKVKIHISDQICGDENGKLSYMPEASLV